jgi:hypothetical protein
MEMEAVVANDAVIPIVHQCITRFSPGDLESAANGMFRLFLTLDWSNVLSVGRVVKICDPRSNEANRWRIGYE